MIQWHLIFFLQTVFDIFQKKGNQSIQISIKELSYFQVILVMVQSQRIFFQLLEKAGTQGKYQTTLFLVWAIILFTAGASSYFNAFLFYQDDYQNCPSDISNCNKYVCQLSSDLRSQYVNPDFSSLASDFGDYRCQTSGELFNIQSLIYIGGIIGVVIGAVTNQMISKKMLLVATLITNLLGLTLAIFSPNIVMTGIGLLINFAAKCIQMQVIICYMTQTLSQRLSGKHIMLGYMAFAMGSSLNGLFFMIIKSWKLVLVIYVMVPIVAGLFFLILYVEEAPFDSVTKRDPIKSYNAFLRIARINGIENHGITLQEIQKIKRRYAQNEQKKHDYVISVLDLFRFKSLRMMTILSIVLHFLISFQFNSPELALQDYSLNVYLNGMVIGSSEVVSCLASFFLVNNFKRKKIIYITEFLALACSVALIIFATCLSNEDSCSIQIQIIQTIGLFFFRFLITLAYNFFYMIQYVVFPTQIRALGLQTTAIASYTAIVVFPQILAFCYRIGVSIIYTFAMTCVLVILFTFGLPETYEVVSPDMISQLKFSQHETFHEEAKQT